MELKLCLILHLQPNRIRGPAGVRSFVPAFLLHCEVEREKQADHGAERFTLKICIAGAHSSTIVKNDFVIGCSLMEIVRCFTCSVLKALSIIVVCNAQKGTASRFYININNVAVRAVLNKMNEWVKLIQGGFQEVSNFYLLRWNS